MPSWEFRSSKPYYAYERWWFSIQGTEKRTHGPYADLDTASQARLVLFQAWASRARALGGDAVRLEADRWVVTLPEGVPCSGRPFQGQSIAKHAPMQRLNDTGS